MRAHQYRPRTNSGGDSINCSPANWSIGGAALDVFEVEPLPLDSPLLKMDQVLLAPHNSNSSPEAWEKVHWNTIKNLLEGLNIPCQDLAQFQHGEEKDV